jgi:N-acetylneuraminic acid mutarotase
LRFVQGEKYISFTDTHPLTSRNGAGAIMQGTIYVVSADAKETFHKKLGKGNKLWSSFAAAPFKIKAPFYATVSGVGLKEDGFYIFDKAGSAVYKPADDTWTALPSMSSAGSDLRNMGATAVLGSKIFCIGGFGSAGVSAAMDIFDTAKGQWEQATPLPSKRALHAAAAYNNKLYVFGGTQESPSGYLGRVGGPMNSVVSYDLSSGKWSSNVAQMPDTWHTMGTGPMPVFAGGKILLPEALVCDKICGKYSAPAGQAFGSLQYDTQNDSWEVITSPTPYNRKAGAHGVVLFGAFERGV